MSKQDIANWTQRVEDEMEPGGNEYAEGFDWARLHENWDEFMLFAKGKVMASSTKARIGFISGRLVPLALKADLDMRKTMDLFKLVILTLPRYVDAPSRDAVLHLSEALVRRDELRGKEGGELDANKMGVAEQIIGWLHVEATRVSKADGAIAPTQVSVLLSWTCSLYTLILPFNEHFVRTPVWKHLVTTFALLLDVLLDPQITSKPTLRKGAVVQARRAVRSKPEVIHELVDTLAPWILSTPPNLKGSPLLGLAYDVALHLRKEDIKLSVTSQLVEPILRVYTSGVLSSKTLLPDRTASAFDAFIQNAVTEQEHTAQVLPVIEKMLLRSPEICLPTITKFYASYKHPLGSEELRRLSTPLLSSTKSTNTLVRAGATSLFEAILSRELTDHDTKQLAESILAPAITGKSTGPDHRQTLYAMLSPIHPSAVISPYLVQTLLPLMEKETNDNALIVMSEVLPKHLIHELRTSGGLRPESLSIVIKEMASAKSMSKKSMTTMVGQAFWQISQESREKEVSGVAVLLDSLRPTLEKNIKDAPTTSLTGAGPVDAWATVVIFLYASRAPLTGASPELKSSSLSSIVLPTGKASFLYTDKVYQKVTDAKDALWLLRALELVVGSCPDDLAQNSRICLYIGQALLWLAVDHPSPGLRREALACLKRLSSVFPNVTNSSIKLALNQLLFEDKISSEKEVSPHRSARLSVALSNSTNFENQPEALKESLLVDLLLVSHHKDLARSDENLWIGLIQQARIDPHDLVVRSLEVLSASIENSLASNQLSPALREAALKAVTTLVFVAPKEAVPRFIQRINTWLDPHQLSSLGTYEYGVWTTPPGVAFVDVLSKKGPAAPEKGKDADIRKWEQELRKSLAQKKAAEPTLTKQERALVDAQLAKEEVTRGQLKTLQKHLEDGLSMIESLLRSNTEEARSQLSWLATLLMDGIIKLGSLFVGSKGIMTYIELYESASERLDSYRQWIAIATLRAFDVEGIPDQYTAEPLDGLLGRLLYRIRGLSEQMPFEYSTFSLFWSLLHQVVRRGGIGASSEDDAIEQLVLVLDIIRSHSPQMSDPRYPRQLICEALLTLISQHPKVSRDAISAILEAGETINTSASEAEQEFLIASTLSQEVFVRNACLQAMQSFDFTERDWISILWIACHDDDDQNANLARQLWVGNALDVPETYLAELLIFLNHTNAYVRQSCARSLKECLEIWPTSTGTTLDVLKDYYREKARLLVPEYDTYGMVIASTLDRPDPWETRVGVADSFYRVAPLFSEEHIVPFFNFLIGDEALGDRHADVRRRMLEAGTLVIQLHGQNRLPGLISTFEEYLAQKQTASESGDHIRQAVVILLGSLAQHLQKSDSRVKDVVTRLIDALKTPSEVVQESVADCLTPLAPLVEQDIGKLIDQLYEELTASPKYAIRRGAAYGIAGILRGTGVLGIQKYNIIRRLRDAAADKKSYEARQGASFALEMLARIMGRGFEPYIIQLLPVLLTSFGDANSEVREATIDASKVIMAKLSGYGIKQIMPKVIEGLEEKQWRTKKGSVELLGSMAFCAPKQLSSALPTVIPQLTVVLTDSHAQVRAAGNKSLKQFGEVITNPEIHSLVSTLLKALVDPEKTPVALNALLKKSFVHYIDSASLAIVIPIIERGLRERSADTKRKATQIVGQMAGLTDSKDFIPYIARLMPLVHIVLVDPVPEARATAAKALGTLVERLGEGQFPDLVQDLLKTLRSDTSGVDRQGAAQGLSEVLSGLGMERLEGLLPDIISSASSPRSYVREGFMSLLVYLPATFGTRFQPHLSKIIPPILRGLADTEEYVREASMKAGRMIVVNYSNKAVDLLLPELEQGIFDPGWRIRQSSITLIGELLFRLSGISGKAELEEEEEVDAVVAESSRKVLIETLGQERRDRILGALYLVRQDAVAAVRTASMHIWKALVSNTPRTVREILPTLINQVIDLLSMPSGDQRETAARTIGELCRKFGERILADMLPILQKGSKNSDARIREGVCLAVSEIIENSTEAQREDHEDEIIAIVRRSLVDNAANVRAAAAAAFDILQEVVGARAIDETIPTLLEALRQPGESSGTALQALREVMTVRASTVFPVLIPTLISTPMTAFNARALASLVTVAGNALSKRLTIILTALIRAVENETDEDLKADINEAVSALLGSISDMEGVQTLMLLLAGWVKNESWSRRVSAINFFGTFCKVLTIEFSLYRPDWVRNLVTMMDDRQVEVVQAAVLAFEALIKSIDKDDLDTIVVTLRRTIESCGAPGRTVPGFNLKGSVASMVPVIISGLTTGSNEQREQAAYAIGDLVERTEEAAIKPYVVQFTGPLIRVATQATAYPPGVKVAILKSLTVMLDHIPAHVKPFFPQLSRTFVKSCSDASSLAVRNAAAKALGSLTKSSQTRVDALVTELMTSAQTSDDQAISASLVLALAYVMGSAHSGVSIGIKESCVSLIESAFRERHDDPYLHAISTLFTSLESYPDLLRPITQSYVLQGGPPSILSSLIILHTVEDAPKLFYTLECVPSVLRRVVESIGEPVPGISRPAREAKELIKSTPPYCDDDAVQSIFGS